MRKTIDLRGRRKGSALLITVVIMIIAVAIAGLAMEQSRVGVKHAAQSLRRGQARAAAEAGISYIGQQIAKPTMATPSSPSDYTGSTNNWINQASIKPPTTGEWRPVTTTTAGTFNRNTPTFFAPGDGKFPNIPVFVWLRDTGTAGNDFEIAAYAEIRSGSTIEESEQIIMDLRESIGFSTYMFFSFNQNLIFGAATVNGSVHSNKQIQFAGNPNKTYVTGNATSNTGFINNANGIVSGIKNGAAAQVGRPTGPGNRMMDRAPTAAAIPNPGGVNGGGTPAIPAGSGFFHFQKRPGSPYAALPSTGTDVRTTITVKPNGKMDIVVQGLTSSGTGSGANSGAPYTYTDVDMPPPGNAVMFSDGPVVIKSSDGKFKGDLTIVSSTSAGVAGNDPVVTDPSSHTITVDSNLRYVDQDGDYANVLRDTSNVIVPNPNPTSGWGATGLDLKYGSNAGTAAGEYNPASPNKLGLMANRDIMISDAPSPSGTGNTLGGGDKNILLDINTYSHNGSPLNGVALSTGAKNNLVVSGSQVGWNTAVRYDLTPKGYGLGGLYNFDVSSSTDPPSGWLSSGQAAFGAVRRVSPKASPASYLFNGTNMTTGTGSLYGGYGGP